MNSGTRGLELSLRATSGSAAILIFKKGLLRHPDASGLLAMT